MLSSTTPDLVGLFAPRLQFGESIYDRRGYYRSPVTLSEYRRGVEPANKGKKYPAETLTPDEVRRLMAGFGRGHAGIRNRALTGVMVRSGLRVAEALALEVKDVDLARGTIQVLHGKGDRRRVVGIDAQTGALVQLWLDRRRKLGIRGAPLFCVFSQGSKGRELSSAYVREAFKEAAQRAEIEKRVHPHGLRHTFASELAREGVPLHIIRKLLGHGDLATTARYVDHLAPWEAIDVIRARQWDHLTHEPAPIAAAAASGE